MRYNQLSTFSKEFKKLKKKYRSLDDDLLKLKQYSIELFHDSKILFDNKGIVEIPSFNCPHHTKAYKVRKFACKSLKGGAMSGLRLTYIFNEEKEEITLVEIYYKGNKTNANSKRIQLHLNSIK